jgi:hypothetical protein
LKHFSTWGIFHEIDEIDEIDNSESIHLYFGKTIIATMGLS